MAKRLNAEELGAVIKKNTVVSSVKDSKTGKTVARITLNINAIELAIYGKEEKKAPTAAEKKAAEEKAVAEKKAAEEK
jgi:hypothetical protein